MTILEHIDLLRQGSTDATLLKELRKVKLLTPGHANTKLSKGAGYTNFILHLAPSKVSGFNMCAKASEGCAAACLNTAGRGRFDSIQNSRIRKTLYFVKLREHFLAHLYRELDKIASKPNPVVRLNGTSDIPWEQFDIFERYPTIQFYDYTKVYARLDRCRDISNYHLTFSASESNQKEVDQALKHGHNVAIVFSKPREKYLNTRVIDGDAHDFRFQDPHGVVVGLTAKGMAKKDTSGFVRH